MDPEHIERAPELYMGLTDEELRHAILQRDEQLRIALIERDEAKVAVDFANLACDRKDQRITHLESALKDANVALKATDSVDFNLWISLKATALTAINKVLREK